MLKGAPIQANFNLLINYKNKLEFGGGCRKSNTLNFLAGFHLSEHFRIICTYNKSFYNVVIPDSFGLITEPEKVLNKSIDQAIFNSIFYQSRRIFGIQF